MKLIEHKLEPAAEYKMKVTLPALTFCCSATVPPQNEVMSFSIVAVLVDWVSLG